MRSWKINSLLICSNRIFILFYEILNLFKHRDVDFDHDESDGAYLGWTSTGLVVDKVGSKVVGVVAVDDDVNTDQNVVGIDHNHGDNYSSNYFGAGYRQHNVH